MSPASRSPQTAGGPFIDAPLPCFPSLQGRGQGWVGARAPLPPVPGAWQSPQLAAGAATPTPGPSLGQGGEAWRSGWLPIPAREGGLALLQFRLGSGEMVLIVGAGC